MAQQHIGGSFAPPLSDEKLASYQAMADALPSSPVKDAMLALLPCCHKWWGLPDSSGVNGRRKHPTGRAAIVHLDDDVKSALDPHIPWGHELASIQKLFDALPTGTGAEEFSSDGVRRAKVTDAKAKALRDACFHLLWHVRELDLGREPLTNDMLKP